MNAEHKGRPSRPGIILAAIYIFLVLGVLAITVSSKPSGLGYEWIPFIYLAMPWALMGERLPLLIFGFAVNAGILYLFGALIDTSLRGIFRKS